MFEQANALKSSSEVIYAILVGIGKRYALSMYGICGGHIYTLILYTDSDLSSESGVQAGFSYSNRAKSLLDKTASIGIQSVFMRPTT